MSPEPASDVHTDIRDGWRTINASKWMASNIAYWVGKDLGQKVENRARVLGDFDFDLRWRVGDITSVNEALKEYGLEIVEEESPLGREI